MNAASRWPSCRAPSTISDETPPVSRDATAMNLPRSEAAIAPTFAFLIRHPAHFVALGFGAGLAPFAPGTFGTLVAIPLDSLLRAYLSEGALAVAIVGCLLIGIWAAQLTGRDLGVADHGAIVCDEIVAFLAVLFFVGHDAVRVAVAFGLFRLFDIVKPPPIRWLDASLKNGVGVMVDDLAAAGYTLLALAVGERLFG
jgi:phosphatidylglycerophosphatase A